jgi:transcriptional regulator with XRE-family HTH domain
MDFRFDDIGNRLKAFRLGSGLSADEIARRLGISRAALYRFEKGELTKIDTLQKLSLLLGVSVPTLLGVGVEYIASAVSYFERLRQIEETAERIVVLAGPVSYLLTSDSFDEKLAEVLTENIPQDLEQRRRALKEVGEIMTILQRRKENFRLRRPNIINLISSTEIERFLGNGLVGRQGLSEKILRERRLQARAEVVHLAEMLSDEPMGVQVGIVPDTLPHTGFQIFRQPDRQLLSLSPFRLGEQPNVRIGVAMITTAPEALELHQKAVAEMWRRALKAVPAAKFLRDLLDRIKRN